MSAANLQALLRFLSQDAKVPLGMAMSKVKDLQSADLDSPEKIAKVKIDAIKAIFEDEKVSKTILTAARRVSKKRAGGEEDTPSPSKKAKRTRGEGEEEKQLSPAELEASLALPSCSESEDELKDVVIFSNRAPLALAFVFTLLGYTMPEQPLSSRLSLAQGYIGVTSKARALYLGIEKGKSAEEEGFGKGQPSVWITGKEVKVLRRWGYEWRDGEENNGESMGDAEAGQREITDEQQPPLWALDLEALKKANTLDSVPALGRTSGGATNLPIHTPQAARSYLLKAFAGAPSDGSKKISTAKINTEKETNLGRLLKALEMVYESWKPTLTPEELDKRTWSWYVKVRPDVADGAAGCKYIYVLVLVGHGTSHEYFLTILGGGKNTIKLANILALRRAET
jgi:hypothetical protein